MHIFMSVDIEGVAGVNERLQGQRGNPEYEVARRLMTGEANAAIAGAFAGGATAVTIADSHGPMRNMIADDLDPRARVVSGSQRPLSMIEGLTADHAGVVLIGWHAAGDNFGVLAHTYSGQAFRRIEINGLLAGEPTIFAGHAAEIGVPLLAASGDDRLAGEIEAQFPHARRIIVKRAIGARASDSLSPQAARDLIREQVAVAVKAAKQTGVSMPCTPPLVVDVLLNNQNFADAAQLLPIIERTGAQSIRFIARSHAETAGILAALGMMVSAIA